MLYLNNELPSLGAGAGAGAGAGGALARARARARALTSTILGTMPKGLLMY